MAVAERKKARPHEGNGDLEQKEFEGMESPEIPAISKCAKEYKKAQRDRMSALEVEVSLKEKLIDLMKKHEINSYRDKEIIITLDTKETIKVKSPIDESDDEE